MPKTVLIIGAGPAGLTAAYEILTKTDFQPVILEATNEIGGIAKTVEHHGNRMDIGGHRFFSKNDDVMAFWKSIMPLQGAPSFDDRLLDRKIHLEPAGPNPDSEERVMLVRHRISRIFYLRKFFDYPISMSLQTFLNMGFFRTMRAGFGYLWAAMFQRPEKSLRDFMINRFGVPLYKMFFEDYTQKVWGRNPRDISADWGRQRIKGISLTKAFAAAFKKLVSSSKKEGEGIEQKGTETSFIEQFIYPKKGPGQLWEALAQDVADLAKRKFGADYEVLRMNSPVAAIQTESGRVVSVTTAGGVVIPADVFISSMPIKDLVGGMAGVPEDVARIARDLPYRDFMTVGLLLKKLEIQNKTKIKTVSNIVPDTWIYVQERDVKLGRLQIFNNWSPYLVKDVENTVWMGLEYFCNEGDELWSMSDEAFIRFAIDEVNKIDVARPENVLDSVCVRVPKAYPAYFDSYAEFGTLRAFLDSFPNLYCVGRNGQHRYNNMDHSMLSAMEAVRLIGLGETNRETLWNVNAEQEYHEEKS